MTSLSSGLNVFVSVTLALASIIERLLQIFFNTYAVVEPYMETKLTETQLFFYTKYRHTIIDSVSIPLGIAIGVVIIAISNQTVLYDSLDISQSELYGISIVAGVIAPYVHQLVQIGTKLQQNVLAAQKLTT